MIENFLRNHTRLESTLVSLEGLFGPSPRFFVDSERDGAFGTSVRTQFPHTLSTCWPLIKEGIIWSYGLGLGSASVALIPVCNANACRQQGASWMANIKKISTTHGSIPKPLCEAIIRE